MKGFEKIYTCIYIYIYIAGVVLVKVASFDSKDKRNRWYRSHWVEMDTFASLQFGGAPPPNPPIAILQCNIVLLGDKEHLEKRA